MEFKELKLEVKEVNEGKISGYAIVFGNRDSHDDIIVKDVVINSDKVLLLFNHDKNTIIGKITKLVKDDYGLKFEAELILSVQKAKEIYDLLKEDALDGVSIGYYTNDFYRDKGIRYLTEITLKEISIVSFPSNELAIVDEVKESNDRFSDIRGYIDEYIDNLKKLTEVINSFYNYIK